ncbi:MAG: DUF1232 domain-containing protein [Anaerolineae bacterium]|nr:DUF1232 domain-containing protein [Anaerolineae bacterium]
MSKIPLKANYLSELLLHLRLWWRLLRDPRVPGVLKLAVPALALVYVLWPADLLLDLVPVLGQVDDVLVLLLALRLFESWAPRSVVTEHLARLRRSGAPAGAHGDDVIDGEYRIL